mgnify:CR=1 FL=1
MSEKLNAREKLVELGLMTDGVLDELETAYALCVAMVVADGKIDPDELYFTYRLGSELFPGFDAAELEQRCRDAATPPAVGQLLPLLAEVLDKDQKSMLFDFIFSVCQADGEVAPEEMAFLDTVSRELGLDFAG